jgi:hypothetical protein
MLVGVVTIDFLREYPLSAGPLDVRILKVHVVGKYTSDCYFVSDNSTNFYVHSVEQLLVDRSYALYGVQLVNNIVRCERADEIETFGQRPPVRETH